MTEAFICDAVRTPIGRYGGSLAQVRADDLAAIPIRALIERNPRRRLGRARRRHPRLRQPGRRGQSQPRPHGRAARRPARHVGRRHPQPAVRLGHGRGGDGGAGDPRRRGGDADRRRLGEHEPRALRDGQGDHAPSTAMPRCTTPRSAGASSIRRCSDAYGDDTMPLDGRECRAGIPGDARGPGRVRRPQPGQGRRGAGERPLRRRDRRRSRSRSARAIRWSSNRDEHPRETSVEALAKLRPIVRPDGTVTAGNASGVNDGAAALIVATEDGGEAQRPHPARPLPRRRRRRRAAADHGHRPGAGLGEAAEAARPHHRRHGRDRTERSLRRPGPRGDAPTRPRRRRPACEPERRRHRARPPARHVRRPPGRSPPPRNSTATAAATRCARCASASARASRR